MLFIPEPQQLCVLRRIPWELGKRHVAIAVTRVALSFSSHLSFYLLAQLFSLLIKLFKMTCHNFLHFLHIMTLSPSVRCRRRAVTSLTIAI